MPLTIPTLDDRSYQEILQEALARVPVHNPAWTNFNDSDPGVTLVQLFAFMTESLLYRANRIPERNRLKFLQLLGIPLPAATAARGFVTFQNERGPLKVQPLAADLDVRAGALQYRTTQGLAVLPVEARAYYKKRLPAPETDEERATEDLYRLLYADLLDTAEPDFYTTEPLPAPDASGELPSVDLNDAVDRCLWLALLTRPGEDPAVVRPIIAKQPLTLGLMPKLTESGFMLGPGEAELRNGGEQLVWEIAQPLSDDDSPHYEPLPARTTVNLLRTPGLVEVTLPAAPGHWTGLEPGAEGTADYPPALADEKLSRRVITWLRLRVRDTGAGAAATVNAQVSWVGINASMVAQRATVTGEILGRGSGEPDQSFTVANVPVIPESETITVDGERWHRIDDILAADPEIPVDDPRLPLYRREAAISPQAARRDNVYVLDPEAGTITFGDGAHGRRPPPGATIAANYAFGGGRAGNVAPGLINRSPRLAPGFKVVNPLVTWGGSDAKSTAELERTISATVRDKDRLVTVEDFHEIAQRTPGVDIGRTEIVPLYEPIADETDVPGVVTVLVIPALASADYRAPVPDPLFLETVCRHLQSRRLITTELHVRGPRYRDIYVSVGVTPLGGQAAGPLLRAVEEALRRFLSPLYGGQAASGWPLGMPIFARELEAVVARVAGVQKVDQLRLGTAGSDDLPDVPLNVLDLPRLAAVDAAVGSATPLNQLRDAVPAAPDDLNLTPIPVLATRC